MATLKDTGALKPYIASTLPQLGGGDKLYLSSELKKVQDAIATLIKAAQALEARINAGGL